MATLGDFDSRGQGPRVQRGEGIFLNISRTILHLRRAENPPK